MKVWYVCQYNYSFECGSNSNCLLFSTQEKAEEKFMKLVDSGKDVWGGPEEWILDNTPNKMFSASSPYNSEDSGSCLSVGSHELDSDRVLED